MLSRLSFPAILVFWLTMNALLWRAEFGPGQRGGSPIDASIVLEKVLTAPDSSTLEIHRRGTRIGYCHWYPDVGVEEEGALESPDEYVPEGMLRTRQGYVLKMEGHVATENRETRLRFSLDLRLATDREWQSVAVQFGTRPAMVGIHARAGDPNLEVSYGSRENTWTESIPFSDLSDPQAWMARSGVGGVAAGLLGSLAPLAGQELALLRVEWAAYTDWLSVGHTRVKAYRLQTRVLDRYDIVIQINRVGEIMRVELPNNLVLINEVLTNL